MRPAAAIRRSRVDPDLEAARAGQITTEGHGASYIPLSGALKAVWLETNGESRLVPAIWGEPDTLHYEGKATPGSPSAPRLEMTADLDRAPSGRDRITLELRVIYHDDEVAPPQQL